MDCNPKNLRDGRVFVLAEGRTESLELLINELRKGPIFAHVEDVDVTFEKALGNVYELS
ncbi:Acylphosphatase [Methanosarcina siciliae T4/M]|uniref:Acylphosphatase n=2 Tax=Methanosarcina siciliae TaxID=38027 RepID=A0A0E3PE77_9EURY|nr:Acylphosphatase [Methanosarcina siciliae T4/M]AKB32858.1 Acylphosphatase [Methanosarcina siciliae HI350]